MGWMTYIYIYNSSHVYHHVRKIAFGISRFPHMPRTTSFFMIDAMPEPFPISWESHARTVLNPRMYNATSRTSRVREEKQMSSSSAAGHASTQRSSAAWQRSCSAELVPLPTLLAYKAQRLRNRGREGNMRKIWRF